MGVFDIWKPGSGPPALNVGVRQSTRREAIKDGYPATLPAYSPVSGVESADALCMSYVHRLIIWAGVDPKRVAIRTSIVERWARKILETFLLKFPSTGSDLRVFFPVPEDLWKALGLETLQYGPVECKVFKPLENLRIEDFVASVLTRLLDAGVVKYFHTPERIRDYLQSHGEAHAFFQQTWRKLDRFQLSLTSEPNTPIPGVGGSSNGKYRSVFDSERLPPCVWAIEHVGSMKGVHPKHWQRQLLAGFLANVNVTPEEGRQYLDRLYDADQSSTAEQRAQMDTQYLVQFQNKQLKSLNCETIFKQQLCPYGVLKGAEDIEDLAQNLPTAKEAMARCTEDAKADFFNSKLGDKYAVWAPDVWNHWVNPAPEL